MENVKEFGDTIRNNVLNNSIDFFRKTTKLFGVNYTFSVTNYSNFNNDLYDYYEYKKQVYKYEEDINGSLYTALAISFLRKKKDIEIDDIRDGVYEYLTSDDKKLISKREELKEDMENEYGRKNESNYRRERY